MNTTITKATGIDRRFTLSDGAGSDAIHRDPIYSYAVCSLETDNGLTGTGIALHLGTGNELICQAIDYFTRDLVGHDIEELMSHWGETVRQLSNHSHLRWLGPHKGVVGLALASVSNACFDLWAKSRGVPCWKLLLDLEPEAFVNVLDMSYLEDVITRADAIEMLKQAQETRHERECIIAQGYPGYDTSVGWFNYSEEQIREKTRKAVDAGFTALKLKVGSLDGSRDLRRAEIIREAAGDDATLMVDANQQWTLPQSLKIGAQLIDLIDPFWIEEPTHPDDVIAHQTLARALAPTKIALGEHVPNRILFKNYLQCQAMQICQVDATRVAGVDEFLTVSLMAKKFGIPVVPHVGDMGQIHQHLVLVNHIAIGHEVIFLEHIPHLRQHFVHPAKVDAGGYTTPQEPGLSCDLKAE
ncbi:MAG: enolase C-terminal domain-like protein [Verrucomicrobiota bacterium]